MVMEIDALKPLHRLHKPHIGVGCRTRPDFCQLIAEGSLLKDEGVTGATAFLIFPPYYDGKSKDATLKL